MDQDLMNRTGLFFNFIAGLIISPDVIGDTRLQSWEDHMELRSEKLKSGLDARLRNVLSRSNPDFLIFLALMFSFNYWEIFLSVLFILGITISLLAPITPQVMDVMLAISIILVMLSYILLVIAGMTDQDEETRRSSTFDKFLHHFIRYPLKTPFEYFWNFMSTLFRLNAIALLHLLTLPLDFVLQRLRGNSRLRNHLRIAGITLYILGNIIQFFAA